MMNMKKNIILFAFLFVGVLTGYCQQSAYLFVYFTGNRMSEEAVRMAVSLDGYNYKALNGNQPVLVRTAPFIRRKRHFCLRGENLPSKRKSHCPAERMVQ